MKIIHVTSSQGNEIELCPECKLVVGDTVAFFTMPMSACYNATDEEKKHPLMVFIPFVPEFRCRCKKAEETSK